MTVTAAKPQVQAICLRELLCFFVQAVSVRPQLDTPTTEAWEPVLSVIPKV